MSTNASTAESSSTDTTPQDVEPELDESSEDTVVEDSSEDTEPANGVEQHKIQTQQQMRFGDNGSLEPAEETVETTLGQFDVEISHRDPDTRLDRPEASGIMRDDRPEAQSQDSGEQANLFVDAEEDQITLDGDSAQNQCLFEDDD
jgi:hypothetical protein